MMADGLEQQLPIDAVEVAFDVNVEHEVIAPAARTGLTHGIDRRSNGFASATKLLLSPVDSGPRLNNALPSVRFHYGTLIPTANRSAPVTRIGTLDLADLAAWTSALASGRQVLTFRTRARSSFAPPTCRMPFGQTSG